jgi:tol-pal system protein YbgF
MRAAVPAAFRWRYAALLFALGLAGCVTTPAEDDPLQVRLDDMDRRLGKVERVAGGSTLLEMSQRIDTLQAELRKLRGQVEVLENTNEALRKQQRDLYADLSRRMDALDGGGRGNAVPAAGAPAMPSGGTAPAAAGALVGGAATVGGAARGGETAEQRYGKAFDALKASNYPVAIAGMRDFLAAYPDHELADNAQYWLGEAYYVTRDYENAIGAFPVVGPRWPDSSKAPDAMLKLGYAQFELKRLPAAKQTLTQLGTRYPGTEAARLAQERLRRIP